MWKFRTEITVDSRAASDAVSSTCSAAKEAPNLSRPLRIWEYEAYVHGLIIGHIYMNCDRLRTN